MRKTVRLPPAAERSYLIARPRSMDPLRFYARPGGGRVVARYNPGDLTTHIGPQRLGVVRVRGDWLGATIPELSNGRLAWVRALPGRFALTRTGWHVRADLSQRRVQLYDGRRLVMSVTAAIGAPGSPTPTGRFTVTDKQRGYAPYVGRFVIALSGTQQRLPKGWTGGDRLAIHGTNAPGEIGRPSSAGCLRVADRPLQRLMRSVPVGAPVFIRR